MICTVMQPYIFPYIGYYQLVMLSDIFISYDDVTFIKQGYINRNTILVNGEPHRFTIPVRRASSNTLIKDLVYGDTKKLIKTIEQAYSKAPFFDQAFNIIRSVLDSKERSVATINRLSIESVFQYLRINRTIISSAGINYDRKKNRSDRLIELSQQFECDVYVNPINGGDLYDKEYFNEKGVTLGLMKTGDDTQLNNINPLGHLSIIDLLMNCEKSEILKLLTNFEVHY